MSTNAVRIPNWIINDITQGKRLLGSAHLLSMRKGVLVYMV